MMVFVSIGKVCELLGISLSTAYRWIKSGKLKEEFRTLGNHRRFNLSSIHSQFIPTNNNNKLTLLYSRVSSHDQKQDLITQQSKLLHFAQINRFNNIKLISDLGSGLNFKKSGLNQLLQLILTQQIQTLIINHKDRLLRFGSELIFKLCEFYHIKVIILEDKSLSFEESLTHDVIELMTVFCAKLYGKRSHKNKLKLS
jgi:excisionase family DNA binding protein